MTLVLRDGGRTRLLPPAWFWLAVLAQAALHLAWPWADLLDAPWIFAGLVPLTAGAVLNLCVDQTFKRRETTIKPYRESTALVVDGAFAFSRHPMYLGMTLVLAGIALLLGSLSPWLAVVAFAAVMDLVFVRVEERMLARRFGAQWDAYRGQVRRWL